MTHAIRSRRRACATGTALCVVALLAGVLIFAASPASAAATTMVDLGRASSYAALSGASVGNTVSAVGAPHTTLRGDLGVKANTQPTGFPPGNVTGEISVGNATAAAAHDDLVAAYAEVAARAGGALWRERWRARPFRRVCTRSPAPCRTRRR